MSDVATWLMQAVLAGTALGIGWFMVKEVLRGTR